MMKLTKTIKKLSLSSYVYYFVSYFLTAQYILGLKALKGEISPDYFILKSRILKNKLESLLLK